ncbi:MAG: hypothetical protein ACK40G_14720 [Cytophagaceae bacterium]
MSYYAYKIKRDYGFAPNPFGGYCTLACCKPHIRKKAVVNDWIIGTGAVENNLLYHLIFLMKVTEKLTFEEYWSDKRFARKKPVLNGSLKQIHGDNIYYKEEGSWCQLDSHHSLNDGKLNERNLNQDLRGNYVLISDHFIYFGSNSFKVPDDYKPLCPNSRQRDYITIRDENLVIDFIEEIKEKYRLGIHGDPINWKEYHQLSFF